jgi:Fe-S cluster biosynthesis and repair protein YggX
MNFINESLKDKQIQKDVLSDWLQFGTMFVVSQILSQKSLCDINWVKSSLHTLIGFTVYNVLTKKVIPNNMTDNVMKSVFDDWVKVGTMLVVSRLLSQQSLTDPAWIRSSLYTLLGFTAYTVAIPKIIPNTATTQPMKGFIDDMLKVGTMLGVSRKLSGLPFDSQWTKESLFTLAGFGTYALFTKNLFVL